MSVGQVSETVNVSADSPALNTARIDVGHTMSNTEVHNLPLVARNPYNFALVQPGVTGTENVEFGVPRLAANGASMRINYMIDGNTNTEKDRAGLRLLPMSEVMIEEVKVVTTGFAPEFGQTMGMVYNAVTPSGTNKFRGEGSYLFRRKPFSAFPFFFGCGSTTAAANCPSLDAVEQLPGGQSGKTHDDFSRPEAGDARRHRHGRRRRSDRQEQALLLRRMGADAARPVVDEPDHRVAGGGRVGRRQGAARRGAERPDGEVQHRQGRLPARRRDTRLTARWIQFHNDAPYNSGGGTATLERGHRLPRRDGLDRGAAGVDTGQRTS